MSFNPYQTTAEQFAEIMNRHEQTQAHMEDNACTSHEILSVPTGQSYGEEGHIPCDHYVIFYYPKVDGHLPVRSFNGHIWK
jgi:hypothetical protein